MSELDVTITRKARSELRRWCEHSGTHMDSSATGSCEACYDCDKCADTRHNRTTWEQTHTARLRRMLVCDVCEQGYFNRAAFDAHECHDAY